MPRVLLVSSTTGYQLRAFDEAARRIGVQIVCATDRCHLLEDPWRDAAVPVRFHDEGASVDAIVESTVDKSIDGVVAVGDRPAVIAALAAQALGVPASPPEAVRVAGNKLMTRTRLRAAGLPAPWFFSTPCDGVADLTDRVRFPCVLKPLHLAASRGVIRADTPADLARALSRLERLLRSPDVRALRDPANDVVLIEEYLPGHEIAMEGLVTDGMLEVLAWFDKPDPLEGPFFEETIYVTPAGFSDMTEQRVRTQVEAAVAAIGLTDGPVHAECRLNDTGVFVLEVAPRPIGGLCSRMMRFESPDGEVASLEDVILQHALGRVATSYRLAPGAAGVMMIPIPHEGRYRRVDGLDEARRLAHIDDVVIAAKVDQRVVPLPEGASYLGFIFARARHAVDAVSALRRAHACLRFEITPSLDVSELQG